MNDDPKNAVKSETVSPAREFEIARLAVRSNEYLEVFWGAMPIKQFELYEREKAETFVSAFNLKLNIQFELSSQAIGAAAKEAAEELWAAFHTTHGPHPDTINPPKDEWIETGEAIILQSIEKARTK